MDKDKIECFAEQVELLLITCNDKEFRAAVERLKPPTCVGQPQNKITSLPVRYFPDKSNVVVGWFGNHKTVVLQAGMGEKCRTDLEVIIEKKGFPNVKWIVAAGVAYSNDRIKRRFADVLVSKQVVNATQCRIEEDKIINRGFDVPIHKEIYDKFIYFAAEWSFKESFVCSKSDESELESQIECQCRTSKAHVGTIISRPDLVDNKKFRDKLWKHYPNAIGGEMEGWVLLELQEKWTKKELRVIIIKAVVDYADGDKEKSWQWTAAKAAIDCVHYCLEKTSSEPQGELKSLSCCSKQELCLMLILCCLL